MAEHPLIPSTDLLPEAVQALRTERERAFCWHYMWNGANGAAAAREAGYSDVKEGAKVRAHELLTRQDILEAIRELGQRYLYSLQPRALIKLGTLLDSENERVALKATDMVLSRTGMAERTGIDVTVAGEVRVVDHTKQAVDDLRKMIELGIPRETLLKHFGFSGLSRYEKLLAAADNAKLIEAKVADEQS